jgi:hypothetical protein
MEKKEIRASLNEPMFTNLCKHGFIKHQSTLSGVYEIRFTRLDMKHLCSGDIVEKQTDDAILKLALQDLGSEMIREIVKRSPIYSELAQEI